MRKTLVAVLVAVVFWVVAPFPSAGQAGIATGAAPAFTVVSDAPDASPTFVNFFRQFKGALLKWWQNGGQTNTKRKWTVVVSEYEYLDANLKFRGVMMTATSSGSSLKMSVEIQPILLGSESEALKAADFIIAAIETIEEVDGR
ncbi:MAG: hypothetical protein HY433_02830 [Candidatus Liptonbacteria bacterium]|nr:hypothetical protein [Candidatus Liptonbacteria bacterium]